LAVAAWHLQEQQLIVKDVVVLIDREQGGAAHLAKNGLNLHAAFKLSAMLDILQVRVTQCQHN
jgi:uridine monophosphate synthetase